MSEIPLEFHFDVCGLSGESSARPDLVMKIVAYSGFPGQVGVWRTVKKIEPVPSRKHPGLSSYVFVFDIIRLCRGKLLIPFHIEMWDRTGMAGKPAKVAMLATCVSDLRRRKIMAFRTPTGLNLPPRAQSLFIVHQKSSFFMHFTPDATPNYQAQAPTAADLDAALCRALAETRAVARIQKCWRIWREHKQSTRGLEDGPPKKKLIRQEDTLPNPSRGVHTRDAASDVSEMSNLNFESVIGGPLRSVIKAQEQMCVSSFLFLLKYGFEPDGGSGPMRAQMVNYPFEKTTETGEVQKYTVSVPLIMMMQVPYLFINTITLHFNVDVDKINKTMNGDTVDFGMKMGVDTSLLGATPDEFPVGFEVSASYKLTSQRGTSTARKYTMDINLVAQCDPMSIGVEKVMEILDQAATESPVDE